MRVRRILLSLFLLIPTILVGEIWTYEAKGSAMTATSADARLAFRPVIEFGHEGGNLRPYRIGIDASGQVRVLEGSVELKTRRILAEKVRELVLKASDKSFWAASAAEEEAGGRKVLPDFGFVFVKVRETGGRHRVVLDRHGQQIGPLGSFYTQLSALVLTQP